MILFVLRLAAYLSTVFTSFGRELKLELEEKWKSWAFFDRVSYCINVFFDNFGSRRTWKPGKRDVTGGYTFVDNSGESVAVRKLTW